MKRTYNAKMISILLLSTILAAGCSSKAADPANGAKEGAAGDNAVTASASAEHTAAAVSSDAAVQLASQDVNELADFDENDGLVEWSKDSSTGVVFSGAAASVSGSGASAEGGIVTIDAAGTYVVSGTVSDGQLVVHAPEDAVVHLVLNGAQITNQDGPAIDVKEADKTIVTLQEGTDNSMADVGAYADTSEEAPTAAIYSKGDLTLNGTGTLTVQGKVKDGITSKDDLKLMSGVIRVKAADDGIVGRDLVAVKDGSVTVEAGGDGIKSTNDTDADKGYVAVAGGTFDIASANDGIQAASSMLIGGGTFNLVSGGGSAASTKVHQDDRMRGGFGQSDSQEGEAATADTESTAGGTESTSAKGLKATANVAIANGSFQIDAADDALHSNGNVAVTGGEFAIASGDDGMHADGSTAITGGSVHITKSYEGIEGASITVAGGDIHVVASDDGINVGGGNDGSGGGGGDMFAATDGMLTISGGYLVVDSGGDGLDSNGSAVMTGGTAIVNGPTENNNAPLDFNGTFEQTGGKLIAAGSAGMAQAPSDSSSQLAVMMTFPSTQAAGTLVTLTDSSGAVVAAYQPSKTFSSIVISSPELKSGESYTISTGGKTTGTAVDGLFEGASVSGSTTVVTFEMGDKVTYVNESGVTTAKTGGFGGGGGGGRGGKGGGFRGQGAPDGAPGDAPPDAPSGAPGDGQGAPPSLEEVN